MAELELAAMQRIAQTTFTPSIGAAFGAAGTLALREVLDLLLRLFERIEPAQLKGTLYVFRMMGGASPSPLVSGTRSRVFDLAQLKADPAGDVVIELEVDGTIWSWSDSSVDEAVSHVALLYRYRDRGEHFIVNGVSTVVTNPSPVHASVFARPTFSRLEDALVEYERLMARTSMCFILREAWADSNRLFLKSKPEWIMRRSLHQALHMIIRDAEVRPEAVMDESKPVDIKVTWTYTNRLAIIEIKWLGDSRTAAKVTKRYRDARAKAGAKQLADYLDKNRTSAPQRETRGYLVVFDARRRGISLSSKTISAADGLHYQGLDIAYSPSFHVTRADFHAPIRIFLEPICA